LGLFYTMANNVTSKIDFSELSIGKVRDFHESSPAAPGLVATRGRELIDYTCFDVFGLRKNSKVIKAAQKALEQEGLSTASTRFLSGGRRCHRICEGRLCELLSSQATLIFQSRNQAILSLISCIADERDLLIVSNEIQSPFADAAYLVDSEVAYFDKSNLESLSSIFEHYKSKRTLYLVLDAVSAYSGVISQVPEILTLAQTHKAKLILDESLSFGVLGSRGTGIKEHFKLIDPSLCSLLDFSSFTGAFGAALSGPKDVIERIIVNSRSLAQEVPLSPALTMGLIESFDLLEFKIAERQKLLRLTSIFSEGIDSEFGTSFTAPEIPCVTIPFKKLQSAIEFQAGLFAKGILVETIQDMRPRSETAYLRFVITLDHSTDLFQQTLTAIADLNKRMPI